MVVVVVEVLLYVHKTVGLLGTGAQDVRLDFHRIPEFCFVLINSLLSFFFSFFYLFNFHHIKHTSNNGMENVYIHVYALQ